MKMKLAEAKKSPDWTMKELNEALSNLKMEKLEILKGTQTKFLKTI